MSTPPGPPSGSRDFLPRDMRVRDSVISRVKQCFAAHGFEPLDTPAFERIEVLSGKYGEEGDKLIFKILKRGKQAGSGEADMALRYDLTVPAVRLYAHRRHELPRVFKRYQIGPVWRGERPGRGRFREFMQCDVDIFGAASRLADADVIVTLSAALAALGLEGVTVRLNSRNVLRALMAAYGIGEAQQGGAVTTLDKLDKIGAENMAAELVAQRGVTAKTAAALREDISSGEFAGLVRRRLAKDQAGRAGLAEIDQVIALAAPRLAGSARIVFDPVLARGLDYYTGPIFEISAAGAGGSIAGGGRYDDLCSMFMKERVPVCGGSLGIERILALLDPDAAPTPPRAYVTVWDAAAAGRAFALAERIREGGMAAEVDLTGARLGRQFRTAHERGCRFALVEGPDERAAGEISVKDLVTGAQESVPETGLTAFLRERAVAVPTDV